MKFSLRNTAIWMVVGLIGSAALPSMARKVKVKHVAQQAVAVKDSLSPNDRKRFEYFFLEAGRQHAANNYSAAMDLFEHARQIDPNAAETYFYLSMYHSQLKQDSLALHYMEKAIQLAPEKQTYAENLAQHYIGKQQYDKAIDAYEDLYARNHGNTDALHILVQLYQQQKNFPMMLKTISRLETEEGESEQYTLSKMRIYE